MLNELNDMLGKVVAKLVGMPVEILRLIYDLLEKLGGKKGDQWRRELKFFLRKESFSLDKFPDLLLDWRNFYKKHFNKDYDFSNIIIFPKPKSEEEKWRLLLVVEDISIEQLYYKCKKLFKCWRWTDKNLDEEVIYNAQKGIYAIWVQDAGAMYIEVETLSERLIHELKFFDETGRCLNIKDEEDASVCMGSRTWSGNVPLVYSKGGILTVSLSARKMSV